jgi:UDP-N-acetylmuramyl pentapeptide synthase
MIRRLISQYSFKYPTTIVYMLQSTEYQVSPYLAWYRRADNFGRVMKRRTLARTAAARLLRAGMVFGILFQLVFAVFLMLLGFSRGELLLQLAGGVVLLTYPQVWARLIIMPLWLGKVLITDPKHRKQIMASEQLFLKHPGIKIAVLGSYGKTTMKELLLTVLSEEKSVAATPANKNVAISHAIFASKLTGNEDVLVLEYGEGAPGDIARFASVTHPDIAVITGLAPAHLDQYPSLEAAAQDLFSIEQFVAPKDIFVNSEPQSIRSYLNDEFVKYNANSIGNWKVGAVKVSVTGTSFTLTNGKEKLELRSGLLGEHQVGPLAAVAVLAHKLGVSNQAIETGISKTTAFEHRLQPRQLHGGWILDDTYNGNIEGVRAGLKLLATLKAKRKIYVTPGLVDQGAETERVHLEMGEAIAQSQPDTVVLMRNSVTDHIKAGMEKANFTGEVRIEEDPLEFYTNIEHFIASGDIVLMQNDWTDNYN